MLEYPFIILGALVAQRHVNAARQGETSPLLRRRRSDSVVHLASRTALVTSDCRIDDVESLC